MIYINNNVSAAINIEFTDSSFQDLVVLELPVVSIDRNAIPSRKMAPIVEAGNPTMPTHKNKNMWIRSEHISFSRGFVSFLSLATGNSKILAESLPWILVWSIFIGLIPAPSANRLSAAVFEVGEVADLVVLSVCFSISYGTGVWLDDGF